MTASPWTPLTIVHYTTARYTTTILWWSTEQRWVFAEQETNFEAVPLKKLVEGDNLSVAVVKSAPLLRTVLPHWLAAFPVG